MLLKKSTLKSNQTIKICGSKSISNRLLILNHLFDNILIENLSNSQDTELLEKALNSNSEIIDIHHAGTAMRFLTSYFAIQEGKTVVLTGSERMKQRPIKFLVDALKELGSEISYLEDEGFPPLKITGKKLEKSSLTIPANISSQFISSLMLIGGKLENGLKINLEGEITSRPYLEMTLKILRNVGISTNWEGNIIQILPDIQSEKSSQLTKFVVESDWSSASYFYSLAQTLCVTATALNIPFTITGLQTLKVKETDRLLALKNELFKIGCIAEITDDSIKSVKFFAPNENISIETYNDHRMAMSFAPFCLVKELNIENEGVVEKSYPEFWEDLKKIAIEE